jgi:spermidine synthase
MTSTTAFATAGDPGTARHGLHLFLVGFLVLFLELASIRWFSAYVIFLQFFSNVTLMACFLGMSCGCLAARSRRDWLGAFPLLALSTVVAAIGVFAAYHYWTGLVIDVGGQASPQEVFFGTEYRNPDVAQFVVPIELVAGFFFVMIALMFVGLGQVLGRAFDAYPGRIAGYSLNVAGSLAGIAGFSLLSMLQAPPLVWFTVVAAGVAFLLREASGLTGPRTIALVALLAMVVLAGKIEEQRGGTLRWSPYYAVNHNESDGGIFVNNIGHQAMVKFEEQGSPYSLIHLLQSRAGGTPFRDLVVIGAGSGNDLSHALRFGVEHIDAVEIDPVIQSIGRAHHPNRPYDDPRVQPHLDDGRHFLRTTDRKYDLAVYALVDSLILHSGYANIRLESYLFTREAFEDVRRALKPDGVFVTYNYFRQGWIVERAAAMAEEVFGCKPIVLHMPFRETMAPTDNAGFAMVIAGCNPAIAAAFAEHAQFWLNDLPPKNMDVNGFTLDPASLPESEREGWKKIAPSRMIAGDAPPELATDDWPFLYLQGRLIPDLSLRSIALLGGLGLVLVWAFLPRGDERRRDLRLDGRMFFLGAAFMLLETRAVVQLALLFGSTWAVNSMVFAAVLVLILLANVFVQRMPGTRLAPCYAGLVVLILAGIAVPTGVFLDGGVLWRYVAPCALALGPMFFSGILFARSFADVEDPDAAFGANIAGSVVGGLSEAVSMLVGFRFSLLLALAYYLLSAWGPSVTVRRRG